MNSIKETCRLIHSDIQRRIDFDKRHEDCFSYLRTAFSPPLLAQIIWRWACYFHGKKCYPIMKLLYLINTTLFAMELQPEVRAGEGLVIIKPQGILIHNNTVMGTNCTLFHEITLTIGPRKGMDPVNDYVRLGDRVMIGPGVRIIGNITIDSDIWIEPNQVVMRSIHSSTSPESGKAL